MATSQDWNYTLLAYFIIVGLVSLLGVAAIQQHKIDFRTAGLTDVDTDYYYAMTGGYNYQVGSGAVGNLSEVPTADTGIWSWGSYIQDLFSLLVFNISLTTNDFVLMNYWWIFRMIFIILPAIMVVITIYHSVRSGA